MSSPPDDATRGPEIEAAVRRLAGITDVAVLEQAAAPPGAPQADPAGASPDRGGGATGAPLADPATARPAVADGGAPPDGDVWPATLAEALEHAARIWPDRGTTYVRPDGTDLHQSYPELLAEARLVLTGLRRLGLRPGDSVMFQLPDNRDFVTTFWACVLGGFLPTPVSVAPRYDEANSVTRKLFNAWQLLDRPPIVTGTADRAAVAGLAALWGVPELRVATVPELTGDTPAQPLSTGPDDLVLQLLTSGSTGLPKCVRHTSRSLLARVRSTAAATGLGSDDIGLNWMPLDHVGGIVMYNLRDVVLGCQHVSAPLETFFGRPTVLLDWIERYRATNTWAPSFAFALLNTSADEIARGSWDLSSMTHVCNAGEMVVADVAHRFLHLLAPHGLPADAMVPCWGMSETSSGVTFARMHRDDPTVSVVRVDARSLGGPLCAAPPDSPHAVTFTDVGPPIPGVRLRIVDPAGAPVPEGTIGGLQVRGNTMMAGYYGNPEANRESYTDDGWFRTGDLGFLLDGRLALTGREKDVIIVGGANYVNSEIEPIVDGIDGVRVTWAAACALPDPDRGTDQLGVFFVPVSKDPATWLPTVREIRNRLSREVGLVPGVVVPMSADLFPRTQSGKIQRSALSRNFSAGRYDGTLRQLAAAEIAEAVGTRFHTVVWRPAGPATAISAPAGPWQVVVGVAGDGGLATALAARLPVDVDRTDGTGVAGAPAVVVHCAGLPMTGDSDLAAAVDDIVLSLPRLLRSASADRCPEVVVVTSGAVWTRPGDEVDCAKTALPGLVRTARAEGLPVRLIDVVPGPPADLAGILLDEVGSAGADPVVAYRDGVRLVPRLRSVEIDAAARPAIEAGGRYLITGGLGGIGFQLAQYLLAAYQVRLLVTGRTRLADDAEARERCVALCELGEVRYVAVDVADAVAMAEAVQTAEAHWGRSLTGVLHLAGADVSRYWDDLAGHRLRAESDREFRRAFGPKVFGTWALGTLLATRPDTTVVLFSSVNGHFGGGSFGAYAAASSFQDGFADRWGRQLGRPVRCLAWSAWSGAGMNRVSPASAAAAQRGFRTITVDEGLAAFLAASSVGETRLLIGLDPTAADVHAELDPRERRPTALVVAYAAAGELPAGAVEHAVAATDIDLAVRCVRVSAVPRDPRGGLDRTRLEAEIRRAARHGRPKEEPLTDLERRLAVIWGEVLDAVPAGRRETFFELGGTSLRAAELVAQVNRELGTRLSVRELYQNPTVASLADSLAANG